MLSIHDFVQHPVRLSWLGAFCLVVVGCGNQSADGEAPPVEDAGGGSDASLTDGSSMDGMEDGADGLPIDAVADVFDALVTDGNATDGPTDQDVILDVFDDAPVDGGEAGMEGGLEGGVESPPSCYFGDFETAGVHQAACITSPLATRVLLDTPELLGSSISGVAVARDGSGVAVAVRPNVVSRMRVYFVPLDGTEPRQLLTASSAGSKIEKIAFSNDGNWIGILADFDLVGTRSLYVAPVSGGVPKRVSPPVQEGLHVTGFAWSPIDVPGAWLAFSGDLTVDGIQELWITNVTSTSPTVLLAATELGAEGDVQSDLSWDDEGRVVFRSNYENGIWELFRAHRDGSLVEKVPGTSLLNDQGPATIGSFGVSPDGKTLAFSANSPHRDLFEVFVVGDQNGTAVRVSDLPALRTPGMLSGPAFNVPMVWSWDGSLLAVVADWRLSPQDWDDTFAAFVLPMENGSEGRRVLGATQVMNLNVRELQFTTEGSLMVRGDLVENGVFELYLVEDTMTEDQDPLVVRYQQVPPSGDVLGLSTP